MIAIFSSLRYFNCARSPVIPDHSTVIPDLIGNPADFCNIWIPIFMGMICQRNRPHPGPLPKGEGGFASPSPAGRRI
ncbi:hypothetical protein KAH81_07720 [bacterium]|nr:hypothetical protein [bacterium]